MTATPLALSLGHATQLLGQARAMEVDLPGIDLPPMGGGTVSEAALKTVASLYFTAEIEATYLPAIAEQLALNRFTLNLTDRAAAEQLEALATAMHHQWLDRAMRNQIYLRCFGLGEPDANHGDSGLNREFEPLFARLCAAFATSARDLQGWGAPAGAAMRAAVAAQSLTGNLASRMQGNTLIVAERLTQQLQLCLTAMNHPGLVALFMGRSAWDVVRSILGPDTPDLTKPVSKAQSGLRLLSWISANLPAIQTADAAALIPAITAEQGLQAWSEMWLDASGIPAPQSHGALQ